MSRKKISKCLIGGVMVMETSLMSTALEGNVYGDNDLLSKSFLGGM